MATVSSKIRGKRKRITFEEFCEIVPDGQKADLIDGVIYMSSPDNTDANDLSVWLIRLLGDYVELKDLGRVFALRVAFRLDDGNGPEPDIGFVRKERLDKVERGAVKGPPDVAVEVVSPESEDRDYNKKFVQYEKGGVKEYWIVDEIAKKVKFWRRDRKGKFREVRRKKGLYHSKIVTGFWFRPEWFWLKPLPKKMDILNQILSSNG